MPLLDQTSFKVNMKFFENAQKVRQIHKSESHGNRKQENSRSVKETNVGMAYSILTKFGTVVKFITALGRVELQIQEGFYG